MYSERSGALGELGSIGNIMPPRKSIDVGCRAQRGWSLRWLPRSSGTPDGTDQSSLQAVQVQDPDDRGAGPQGMADHVPVGKADSGHRLTADFGEHDGSVRWRLAAERSQGAKRFAVRLVSSRQPDREVGITRRYGGGAVAVEVRDFHGLCPLGDRAASMERSPIRA